MALVPCPECQKEVSTQALACPQCALPFPGKQSLSEGSQSHTFSSCPCCGLFISKQARSCPHCGQCLEEHIPQNTNENISEETWLCPHCGTPYTRKIKQQEHAVLALQETSIITQPNNEPQTSATATDENENGTETETLLPLCNRSPLWQDPSARKETAYPRYPRSRKNSFVAGFIIFVLVATSIVLGAFWQYQGITPLNALFFWQK